MNTLKKLRNAAYSLGEGSAGKRPVSMQQLDYLDTHELVANIRRALFTFDSTSNYALGRMFRREDNEFKATGDIRGDLQREMDDGSETLCLVYLFVISLCSPSLLASDMYALSIVTGCGPTASFSTCRNLLRSSSG